MKKRFGLTIFLCAIFLFFLSIISIFYGAVRFSFDEILNAIFDENSSARKIVFFVRFPRLFAAILCGSALSVSGALIQIVLQNPLGSPNVLGMNAGAGLCVVVCAYFLTNPLSFPLAAFFGAFITLLLVCALGKKAGNLSSHSVLLSGVAANAFFCALTDGVNAIFPDTIYSRSAFRIGSLSGVQMNSIIPAAIVIFCAIFFSILISPALDVLLLGDEQSKSLGLNANRTRFFALVLSSLLCGASVSFAGLLGFVGLIVPHSARLLFGGKCSNLLILSAFLGANLVLFCDFFSRTAFSPYELPVGVILSLLGGIFFFYLLVKNRKAGK